MIPGHVSSQWRRRIVHYGVFISRGDHARRCYGIVVLTITGDQVATITGFPGPDLFPIFHAGARWRRA